MKVKHSTSARARQASEHIVRAMRAFSERYLREVVKTIAIPRHADAESANNRKVAAWITNEFESFGYVVSLQGTYDNIVAMPATDIEQPIIVVGAHYDSVPKTPGADDNASAVAAMLACARALADVASEIPVCFVAFNREEDGFLGSEDFVANAGLKIKHAHILEMVGYASEAKGSQKLPPLLPVRIPDTGNFLGILGNGNSTHLVDSTLSAGKSYLPDFPIIGLKLYLGTERVIPNMTRSDHVSFWEKRIPATMWTDTADFRNPNYHRRSDTADTLNYRFLANVTRLLIACVANDDNSAPTEL